MEFSITDINWIGIIVATLVYFMFGGLWFSKIGFGKKWEEAIGFNRPKEWKETSIYFIVPFLGCLLASIAISILITLTRISSIKEAIILGLITGIGFATSISFTNAITPTMNKPKLFGTITGMYHLTGIILISIIIYTIGK